MRQKNNHSEKLKPIFLSSFKEKQHGQDTTICDRKSQSLGPQQHNMRESFWMTSRLFADNCCFQNGIWRVRMSPHIFCVIQDGKIEILFLCTSIQSQKLWRWNQGRVWSSWCVSLKNSLTYLKTSISLLSWSAFCSRMIQRSWHVLFLWAYLYFLFCPDSCLATSHRLWQERMMLTAQ